MMWILAKFGEKFDGMIQEALLIYSESFIMIAVDSQNKQTNKQTHKHTCEPGELIVIHCFSKKRANFGKL